jgi:predicted nucleotidyltransferase
MPSRPDREEVIRILREAGARFALVFGSRARGDAGRDSDLDVAAWWPSQAPASFEVALPAGVDLLVLNGAPLELAGRAAIEGELLFDDDPPRRVEWQATTRKIYADEEPRQRILDAIAAEALRRG